MFLRWEPTLRAVPRARCPNAAVIPTKCCRRVWGKLRPPALLGTLIKGPLFSDPSAQALFVRAHKCSSKRTARLRGVRRRLLDGGRRALRRFRRPPVPSSSVRYILRSCSVLVHCLCKVFEGLSAMFVLVRGKSVIDRQRCSHGDQFVVILLVMLLLSVVFNNSTIYGQKYELE